MFLVFAKPIQLNTNHLGSFTWHLILIVVNFNLHCSEYRWYNQVFFVLIKSLTLTLIKHSILCQRVLHTVYVSRLFHEIERR